MRCSFQSQLSLIHIFAYQETGEMPHEQEFGKAKLSLIFAMNKDLMHYHAPAISLDIQ